MISLKNTQKKISVSTEKLLNDAQIVLNTLKYSDYDLGIWLTTDATIKKYNTLYRDKNKPTDILSFPFHTQLKAGERIKPLGDDDKNLGDIIISCEYVARAAQKLGVTFQDRMQVLLVHGICHLLGYDHITDEDFKIMQRKEKALLKILGKH